MHPTPNSSTNSDEPMDGSFGLWAQFQMGTNCFSQTTNWPDSAQILIYEPVCTHLQS